MTSPRIPLNGAVYEGRVQLWLTAINRKERSTAEFLPMSKRQRETKEKYIRAGLLVDNLCR